ncbi:MAG TPA: flagellar filament capping protein FliD [Sphingomonas sp.]|nr:flagellar filament capping protein FliD [Sphingomonas sp.]
MTTTSSTGSTSTGTTSATASIVSQLNAGSGIDTGALVDQLVAAQFAVKQDQLTTKGDTLKAEISAVGQLQSDITGFASALSNLIKGGTLQTAPTSSNSGILTVTGQPGATLAGLSAQLEVDQLATAQSAATGLIADPTAAIGGGTLTLTFGTATVSGGQMTGFTAGTAPSVNIAIDPANSSLQDIAKAINAADAGVTATIVADSGGARLMLKGATGAEQAFTLTATEDPSSPGLSALDVGVGVSGTTIGTAAQDALVTLDGVQFRRSSNSFSDLIPGVAVTLVSAQPGTVVSIGSSRPTSALSQAVTDFVDTYNQMIAEVNSDTDAKSGNLKQDTAAKNLKSMLSHLTLTALVSSSDPNAPTTLAEIGVGTNRDGTLSVDPDQLFKALTQWPDQVEAMFADVAGTSVSLGANVVATGRGLLGALKSISASASSTVYGLGASLTKYQKAQSDLSDQTDALQRQQDATRTRLTQQFATMDAMVSSYKSTQTFLQQQIDAWNGKNS